MIKNYFLIALRNLVRNKFFSIINILGLSVGMASSILILMWVQDEVKFDQFHENIDELYRINVQLPNMKIPVGPPVLVTEMIKDFPEVINGTFIQPVAALRVEYNHKLYDTKLGGIAVDENFLNMFSFKLLQGEANNALANPNQIVITKELKEQIFGKEEAIGKYLMINGFDNFLITGILDNIPSNSHLNFEYVISASSSPDLKPMLTNWRYFAVNPYILVDKKTDITALNKKIHGYLKEKMETERPLESIGVVSLQPVKDIHLRSGDLIYDGAVLGDIKNVKLFTIIAVFILLIACINFMNLSTARSSKRAKEVGLRKVVGSSKAQIIRQFLGEALLIVIIAATISVLLVDLLIPMFNELTNKEIVFNLFSLDFIIPFLIIIFVTGFISGSYPAFYLSSFQPIKVLKGIVTKGSGGVYLRRVLVTTQFLISITLIICTFTILKQLKYIKNKDLGMNLENVISLEYGGELNNFEVIKKELMNNSNIENVATSFQPPFMTYSGSYAIDWEGRDSDEDILVSNNNIDENFIDLFEMELIKGRNFSSEIRTDTGCFIINESMAALIGDGPLHKYITFMGARRKVIGIVKDFHYQSIHQEIGPLILNYVPTITDSRYIKLTGTNRKETLAWIENKLLEFNPNHTFNQSDTKDAFNFIYQSELRIGNIFIAFAVLAIFICGLGLFGLTAFNLEQRLREVSLRKVLGAPLSVIIKLMSEEFVAITLIASAISFPISYYAMDKWLQNFAYSTAIGPLVFILSVLVVLFIGIITISYHSINAVRTNPVNNLRYE